MRTGHISTKELVTRFNSRNTWNRQ